MFSSVLKPYQYFYQNENAMNKPKKKLGLEEISSVEKVILEPTLENFRAIPKSKQTYEMLKAVCQKNGYALHYASKKLITKEVCEIAVSP